MNDCILVNIPYETHGGKVCNYQFIKHINFMKVDLCILLF